MGDGETPGTEETPDRLVGELDDRDTPTAQRSDRLREGTAVFDRKWSATLVEQLRDGPYGFSDLREETGLSAKVLSDTLTALNDAGLVDRNEESNAVEYSLTDHGEDVGPVLDATRRWNDRHDRTRGGDRATAEEVLGYKWDAHLIDAVGAGTDKFGQIKSETEGIFEENPDGISSKVLSTRLEAREEADIVDRTVENDRPVSIRYSLTDAGESLREDVIETAVDVGRAAIEERSTAVTPGGQ